MAAIAVVVGAKLLSDSYFGHGFPPILFLCAVMIGAWYGGLRQGLIASALTTVACGGILVGSGATHLLDVSGDTLRLAVFFLEGVIISSLMESLHAMRRRAEEQSREALVQRELIRSNEQRLRAIQDAALDCMIMLDHQGRILDANPMFETTFGHELEAVRGQVFHEVLMAPEERGRVSQLIAYIGHMPDGTVDRRIETRAARRSGTEFPAELSLAVIRLEDPPLLTVCLRDLTDRVRAEQAVRESRASFERRVRQQTAALERVTADLLVDAAERERLERELRDQNARLRKRLARAAAARRIDTAVASSAELSTVLTAVLDELEVDAAAVMLWDATAEELQEVAATGFRATERPRRSLRAGESHAGTALLHRQTVSIPGRNGPAAGEACSVSVAGEEFGAYHAVPFVSRGQAQGVLEVYERTPTEPDPEWLALLEAVAGQLAVRVDNASLIRSVRHFNSELLLACDNMIESWAHVLDLREHEMEGHCRRVAAQTLKLARLMGIADDELPHIRRGALLHDVGKMAIPDSVLFKAGPLDETELALIRRHPTLAFEILAPIRFLAPALDIPYCHHERWDGTGYPRGLKGDQIPLAARIFALVDTWDALTSDRPFRHAWSKRRALDHIRSLAGTHLDPEIVQVFLESMTPEASSSAPASAWVVEDHEIIPSAVSGGPAVPAPFSRIAIGELSEQITIVIAAADLAAARPLGTSLEKLGHEVVLVDDVDTAWNAVRANRARFVIADWALPGGGGSSLCRQIRKLPTSVYTYVLVVADEGASEQRLASLLAGADDFLPRPLDVRELLVRLDITRRIVAMQQAFERENARLAEQAVADPLTGLKNRRFFHQILEEAFYQAMRHEQPLSLIMIDVDHFKRYNDEFGHPAGDELLCTIATVLRDSARERDIVARYGGEEFVLLLPSTDATGGRIVSERLRRAIQDSRRPCQPVTVSLGVATLGKDTVSASSLLASADLALYRSKEAGRNRVTHHDDLDVTPTESPVITATTSTPFPRAIAVAG